MYNDCSSDLLPSTNQRAGNRLIQAEPGFYIIYFSFTVYKLLSLAQLEVTVARSAAVTLQVSRLQ